MASVPGQERKKDNPFSVSPEGPPRPSLDLAGEVPLPWQNSAQPTKGRLMLGDLCFYLRVGQDCL